MTYSNPSKKDLAGLGDYVVQVEGAVSKAAAKQMAEGALKNSSAQISVATTGLDAEANENGKIGLVWIACAAWDKKTFTHSYKVRGSREQFIERVALLAFKNMLSFIKRGNLDYEK